jgi:hypothetical protein
MTGRDDFKDWRRNTTQRHQAAAAFARTRLRLRVTDSLTHCARWWEVGDPVRFIENELAHLGAYDEGDL